MIQKGEKKVNLLYSSLKSIYEDNTQFNYFYPIDPFYNLLRDFLLENIKSANFTIDSQNLSYKYHLDSMKVLEIFLALSEYGILNKEYFFTCDECETSIIEEDLDNIFECVVCKSKVFNLSRPNGFEIFNNIRYVFSITEDIICELNKDLKTLPSSSSKVCEEEDIKPTNLNSVLNNTDKSLVNINNEKEIIEELKKGMLIS